MPLFLQVAKELLLPLGRRRSRGRMMPRLRGAPPRQGSRNTMGQGISLLITRG